MLQEAMMEDWRGPQYSQSIEKQSVPPCEYWIRNHQGELIRVKKLRDAAENGCHGPYILCDYGFFQENGYKFSSGNVWAASNTIVELLQTFLHTKTKDVATLENALIDENYVYWRIYPISQSFMNEFLKFHQSTNRAKTFFSYRVEDGHVYFEN